MTEMQKQFEGWLNGEFDTVPVKGLTAEGMPVYASLIVQRMWDAWQASRAAVVVKLPVRFPENDDKDSAEVVYILDILEQLALAGVSYE